ncbi:squalene--hopene cyclase [Rickettsiales bacterium]|nr:squalene--hopene cyclase [Rickettsiales bacterium]
MKLNREFLSKFISKALKVETDKINKNGSFVYELEADVTIPSEYILMMHFIGKIDLKVQKKIVNYILRTQNKEGGWPLFYGGKSDISASVKAYFALKVSGFNQNSNSMIKAKALILKLGGAENSNVFTKITLALFGQISWNSIPVMPIEIMKLPKWFPFHLNKISYWSRTVLIPLLIILHEKPMANNPSGANILELFKNKFYNKLSNSQENIFWSKIFFNLDKIIRVFEPYFPKRNKNKCKEDAYNWILKRLNGVDGLGGIFPAMVNSLIALTIDKRNRFTSEIRIVNEAINKLLIVNRAEAYCQPCVSPIWDSGWMGHVLIENKVKIKKTINWLLKKEIRSLGDWSETRPGLKPGGWAFQYNNNFYPDVDDSALIGMLMDRYNRESKNKSIMDSVERTRRWIIGMQSKNGGWGSFDADNDYNYLNYIPFADHGALLDPPTADVTARCISFLAQLKNKEDEKVINKAVKYIISEQEKDGSWYGRWGTNYIYGTWSVLSALNIINFRGKNEIIKKSIKYIKKTQRSDGGWGESGQSYYEINQKNPKFSTPSQTAWAILALMSVGEVHSIEVSKGIQYLINSYSKEDWKENHYTAVGFPKVFYLKYHGYSKYFPLLAVSRYLNLSQSNYLKTSYGV